MIAAARKNGGALAFSLIFAALVLCSGLDRYSEHVPGAVRLVPQPFKVEAAMVEAADASVRKDYAAAVALSRVALDRAPFQPHAISLLGTSLGALGDESGSNDVIQAGRLLGFRDPALQLSLFDLSMREDKIEGAALRVDAVLRARSDLEAVHTMLGRLEEVPGGRRALAQKLGENPVWAEAYFASTGGSDTVLRSRARFLASPDGAAAHLDCDAVRPMIDELGKRQFRAEGEALARRHCPALAARAALADPAFAAYNSGAETPFGWQRQGAGDVRVAPIEGGVEIANRASVTRLALTQPVALAAGTYRLSAEVGAIDPRDLVATLGCSQPERPSATEGSIGGGGQRLGATGCANEVLGLWVRPGRGALTVRRLSLTPN